MHGLEHQERNAGMLAVIRVYWSVARRYPWSLVGIFGSAVVMQAANLAAPLYMRQFFNVLASGTPSPETVSRMIYLIVIVAGFAFLNWIMTRVQAVANLYAQSLAMQELYERAFNYLMRHSYSFFINRFAGSLTHKINKFARGFETLLDTMVYQFFPTLLFVGGAVVILGLHNRVLGAMLGIWAVLFVIIQLLLNKRRRPLRAARAEADSRVTGALADSISNQAAIAQFSGVSYEEGLFGSVIEEWRHATIRIWRADETTWAVLGLLFVGINALLLYGATLFWERGQLTVGDFVLIQAYLLTAFNQLLSMNREMRRFNEVFADAGEMVAMLEMPHDIRAIDGAQPLAASAGAIAFTNVRFEFHQKGNPILSDFNLQIPSHQKVALVGPSGAGKSTITRLLLRLFDVVDGEITIDGQNIAHVTQESLRDAIAYVPQEPILFHRTLMENIRYGRRDASDSEVIDAAKRAHCHEFIAALPDGYDTYVGERGVKLSGGERQRVAIARAILKDAPILLLDEATSSLDSESEALIQAALESLMEGKTVIVIAHRLSTIMKMDRIVVLQKGKIVADGTHEELLKSGGLYHKLWSIQAGGFIDDTAEMLDLEDEEGEEKESIPSVPMK